MQTPRSPGLPSAHAGRPRANPAHLLPHPVAEFLDRLARLGLVAPGEREAFLVERLDRLREYHSVERLGAALVNAGLLTGYQFDRVLQGATHGLVMGSYRVLEELGRGGMGTVYLAEHRLLKRRVAIKVVPADEEVHVSIRQRFQAEMRVLASLSHPNIVMALDAGELPAEGRDPALVYMALELVEGGDLERLVARQGVCGVAQACNYVRQAAAGLQAAHDRHLVHRDLKPSNLLLSSSGQIKLVDFGLARQFSSRMTDPRALLGSVEFMPPEQSHDPSLVGKEADIYGLGATLFWLLTGEGPYPHAPHTGQALRRLQQEPPRRLRALRPELPAELEELVSRMLDRNPANRPASPLAVMNALRPFLVDEASRPARHGNKPSSGEVAVFRVLVVESDPEARAQRRTLLARIGRECGEASDGRDALEAAARVRYDLILVNLSLPDMPGAEACRRLRDLADNPNLKIVALGAAEGGGVPRGADDRLDLPLEPGRLLACVRQMLSLKAAQDKVASLSDQMLGLNQQLEQSVRARQADLDAAHDALLFAMAKAAESRDGETAGHLERMKAYVRVLAAEASRTPPWQGLVDERFLRQLERCVPLHDVGKIGLADEILLKPASLTAEERGVVQTHAVVGDQILESLAAEHGAALDFLGMARTIVRHHHERWDGKGYPDRLAGEAIPPAARLVAVADVYDALRRMRMYKPAMTHQAAVSLMLNRSPGQFDPTLLAALERCQGEFERIYREIEE